MENYSEDLFSNTSDKDKFIRENLSFLIEDKEILEVIEVEDDIRFICRDSHVCTYSTSTIEHNLTEIWTILNQGCISTPREKPSQYPYAYTPRKSLNDSSCTLVPKKQSSEPDLTFFSRALEGQTSTPKKHCATHRKLDFSGSMKNALDQHSISTLRHGLTDDSLDCSVNALSFKRPTTFLDTILLKTEESLDRTCPVGEVSVPKLVESSFKEAPLDCSWMSHSNGYVGCEREQSGQFRSGAVRLKKPSDWCKSGSSQTIYEEKDAACQVCLKESKPKTLTLADFIEKNEQPFKGLPKGEENKENLLLCKFCHKNGEVPKVYGSHVTKTPEGVVVCPILRKYVCDICGASGDNAHTRKYCPLNIHERFFQRPVFRRLSNGVMTTYHNHK